MMPWISLPGIEQPISAYGLVAAVTAGATLVVGPWWIRRAGRFDEAPIAVLVALLFVVGLLGARAFFVWTHWSLFAAHPVEALRFWGGGRHVAGALAAVAIVAPLVLRAARLSAGRFADAGVPVVAVAVALSRLGCFLHGCCAGTPSSVPWAVHYPAGSGVAALHEMLGLVAPGAASLAVHPLPLYFAIAALAIAVVTAWLVPRKRRDWDVVFVGLVLFGASTWLLEPLRMAYPDELRWYGWTPLRSAAAALAIAGAAGLVATRACSQAAVVRQFARSPATRGAARVRV